MSSKVKEVNSESVLASLQHAKRLAKRQVAHHIES